MKNGLNTASVSTVAKRFGVAKSYVENVIKAYLSGLGTPVEIRRNDDGSIDEIIAHGANLHIEQMSDDGWFMGLEVPDGSSWDFWFGAKNGRSAVEFRHMETNGIKQPAVAD